MREACKRQPSFENVFFHEQNLQYGRTQESGVIRPSLEKLKNTNRVTT